MRKNVKNMYTINKTKSKIKLLKIPVVIFCIITALLVFSSVFVCELNVYQRTTDEQGQPQVSIFVFDEYNENYDYDENANTKKITFANMAFGIPVSEENQSFIPVEQDVRFLILYIVQILAYLFVFIKFGKTAKHRFIFDIIGAVLLVGVSITTIWFFNSYAKEIEAICKQAIETIRTSYPKLNITSTIDTMYPSHVDVNMSVIAGVSVGFMLISAVICVYTAIMNKTIINMEKEYEK